MAFEEINKEIKNKMLDARRVTEKQEKKLIKDLTKTYKQTRKDLNGKIKDFIDEYGVDGKLDPVESRKYNRLVNLQKQVDDELRSLQSEVVRQSDNHLVWTAKENWGRTGFALETATQTKLNFSKLNTKAVREALHTPLDNVAIKANKSKVLNDIRRDLAASIAQGESRRDAAKRIQKSLETNANNALRIAQTEQTRIMNEYQLKGMQKTNNSDIELKKEWVATLDDRTRDRHGAIDGEQVELDETFSNGLMRPGDPNGPAEEVINCRCTMNEVVVGFPEENRERRIEGKVVPYKTYSEWKKNRL